MATDGSCKEIPCPSSEPVLLAAASSAQAQVADLEVCREISQVLAHICSMLQLPAAAALFLHASLGSSLCAQFQAGIESRKRALERKRALQPHKDPCNPQVARTACVSDNCTEWQACGRSSLCTPFNRIIEINTSAVRSWCNLHTESATDCQQCCQTPCRIRLPQASTSLTAASAAPPLKT